MIDKLETQEKTTKVRRLTVAQETSPKSSATKVQKTHSFEAGMTTNVNY